MLRILFIVSALLVAATACNKQPEAKSKAEEPANPLLTQSTLPFQAPPFDKIKDSDYQPAIDEGMQRQLAEVQKIADNPEAPTFENTIVAMERTGQDLNRALLVFFGLVQANTNDTLMKTELAEAPRLAAHHDAIYLNDKLYARVKAIYDARATLNLDPQSLTLVERYEQDFVHAGAALNEADKAKLRALNKEESTLSTQFKNELLAGTKDGALEIDDKAKLAGLSDADVAAAAQAAANRNLQGKWLLTLQNTTQQPYQSSLTDRAVRQQLFESSIHRTDKGDANDTKAIVARLAQLRAEKAKLLGFDTYAAYVLSDQMAKTPAAAEKLLTDLVPAARAKAENEAGSMQDLIKKQHGDFQLQPWDWQYYAEQVRKAQYDLDESQLKPYFDLDRVLQDGIFYAAHQLYGISFEERHDIPVYNPDVRVFEVTDADGQPLALWYADYFKRDNKQGGAWMSNFVEQSGLLGTKPVVYNVANFQKPAPGQPALLSLDNVTTMFHEFGHALHGMLSNVKYPTLAGTNVPRDFVELPSQINEHWAFYPSVLAHYARHYKTGEPMPQALVDKIKKSRTFNQGFATMEYLEAALLDLAWHDLSADAPQQDPAGFETAALKRFGVDFPLVPPRYRTTYFAHIWEGGYAAGYYAYMWAEVLDDDAYQWFEENGGLTRQNGQRFRDMILSVGRSVDLAAAYREFRGRDPKVDALLHERGLDEVPAPQAAVEAKKPAKKAAAN